MAILPLVLAIPRFKGNEERVDTFVNGDENAEYITSGGEHVPSIQNLIAEWTEQIDDLVNTVPELKEKLFTGDGVTTTFTLDAPPASKANLLVWVGGSIQDSADYSVTGSTLTITPAVASDIQIRTLIVALVTSSGMQQLRDDAVAAAEQATLAASALPPIVPNRMIVDDSDGVRRTKTFAEVVELLEVIPVSDLISSDGKVFKWGNSGGVVGDGVSDFQAMFFQNQGQFLPNGSLGAIYGQRLNSYAGGANSDPVTPTCAAVRGYNQIQDLVTYCNENGGLFVSDNYSWHGQAVGVFGQANSRHGGRTFGLEAEAIQHAELYTPVNGTAVLKVPNNFTASAVVVTKNGTVLTAGVGYNVSAKPASDQTGTITSISGTGSVVTVNFSGGFTPPVDYCVDIMGVSPNIYNGRWRVISSGPGTATLAAPGVGAMTVAGSLLIKTALAGSITLTTPANGSDSYKVIRGNPEYAASGGEIIVYADGGTDSGNPFSGNRVGLSIFGWRTTDEAIPTNIGTLLNLVSSPSDSYLTVDRGINFQGKFNVGIDFTAANAVFNNFMMKFNGSGAGLSDGGSLLKLGDSNHIGRVQISTGSGAIFGTDTALDVLLHRNAIERLRIGTNSITIRNGTSGGLLFLTDGTHTGRFHVATASGVTFGSDTNIDTIFTRQGTEKLRLIASTAGVGLQVSIGTSYASDAAAAAAGVPVGGVYRNGSALQIRAS